MSLDEFYEWLEKQPIEDKLVYMRYKYSWEDEWTYSNEYLEVDMSVEGYYIWLMDWNEGQEDVEILGCIGVDDIDVPLFKVQEDSETDDLISRQAVLNKKELVELEDGQSFYCISPEDVKTLPSVTPQPKTGKWLITPMSHIAYCSECDHLFKDIPANVVKYFKYCPNCKVKMTESEDKE